LTAIDRLAAADWLLRSGRAAEAAPLLRWHEAVQFPAQLTARGDAMLRAIIHFKRARIEAALGRTDAARAHDARFLREYDSATGAHAPLVDSARAALSGGRAAPPS
jgi:hypothetical protein